MYRPYSDLDSKVICNNLQIVKEIGTLIEYMIILGNYYYFCCDDGILIIFLQSPQLLEIQNEQLMIKIICNLVFASK